MRKRQFSGFAAVALGTLVLSSASAGACDDGCDCGYGYYGYYARAAYSYYYAPPAYYARPAYAYAPYFYGRSYYSRSWDYRPAFYGGWRRGALRRW